MTKKKVNDIYPFAIYNDGDPIGFMIIQCNMENERAMHVYMKVGFEDTGEIEAGEHVMRLNF